LTMYARMKCVPYDARKVFTACSYPYFKHLIDQPVSFVLMALRGI
jgi:hypothetical protein